MPNAEQQRYALRIAKTAARQLADRLPEAVASAVVNFITGDLLAEPRRVGKPLQRELAGQYSARRGSYRIVYRINDDDHTVTVLDVGHRRDIYNPH